MGGARGEAESRYKSRGREIAGADDGRVEQAREESVHGRRAAGTAAEGVVKDEWWCSARPGRRESRDGRWPLELLWDTRGVEGAVELAPQRSTEGGMRGLPATSAVFVRSLVHDLYPTPMLPSTASHGRPRRRCRMPVGCPAALLAARLALCARVAATRGRRNAQSCQSNLPSAFSLSRFSSPTALGCLHHPHLPTPRRPRSHRLHRPPSPSSPVSRA